MVRSAPPAVPQAPARPHPGLVRAPARTATDSAPGLTGYGSLTHLEVWDFGVSTTYLDWSRRPDFTGSPG
jgi:hypothetical protein